MSGMAEHFVRVSPTLLVKANSDHVEKLRNFGTYVEVDDVGQPRISTRWILWYKGEEVQARLVARGFEEEAAIRRDSPTVGRSAVRVLLALAASKKWEVKTTDIKSTFLQSNTIDRDVHVSPPREAGCKNRLWKLQKCLYGLNDAARQFYQSVVAELLALGCTQSAHDPALYYFTDDQGELKGVLVSHIDDFLHAGDAGFDD